MLYLDLALQKDQSQRRIEQNLICGWWMPGKAFDAEDVTSQQLPMFPVRFQCQSGKIERRCPTASSIEPQMIDIPHLFSALSASDERCREGAALFILGKV